MGIDETEPMTVSYILIDHVSQQRRLAGSSFADDVCVTEAIGLFYSKRTTRSSRVGVPKDHGGVHVISLRDDS